MSFMDTTNERIEMLNALNSRYEMFIEQLKLVEQQLSELVLFDEELKMIKEMKNQEIMAPIGKSVFAPVHLRDEKLLVDVGAGYFVRKNIDETKSVIKEQRASLEGFKIQVTAEIDNIGKELQNLII